MEDLVVVKDLSVSFYSYRGIVHALQDIYLDIYVGEVLGLVGETGCGKSTLGLSITRLVPSPGKIEKGQIILEGEDLLKKSEDEMRKIRRDKLAMIFQDPNTSLNPVFRVGDQIVEGFMVKRGVDKNEAAKMAIELLTAVGIPNPEKVFNQYPHELSGGMKQRIMIAIALTGDSKLLIADEPTSSLDVTIQAQILDLMLDMKERTGMSILLITHDMGIVAQTCERVAVMYAGNIIEVGSVVDVFKRTKHPYSTGLLEAVRLHEGERRLKVIPGMVPDLIEVPKGCSFNPRCKFASEVCRREKPMLMEVEKGHFVACHLFRED